MPALILTLDWDGSCMEGSPVLILPWKSLEDQLQSSLVLLDGTCNVNSDGVEDNQQLLQQLELSVTFDPLQTRFEFVNADAVVWCGWKKWRLFLIEVRIKTVPLQKWFQISWSMEPNTSESISFLMPVSTEKAGNTSTRYKTYFFLFRHATVEWQTQ